MIIIYRIKPKKFFRFSFWAILVYVDMDIGPGFLHGKNVELLEMKNDKNYVGFL